MYVKLYSCWEKIETTNPFNLSLTRIVLHTQERIIRDLIKIKYDLLSFISIYFCKLYISILHNYIHVSHITPALAKLHSLARRLSRERTDISIRLRDKINSHKETIFANVCPAFCLVGGKSNAK